MRKRDKLIERLPEYSVGAEIGVWKGDSFRRLIERLSPKRLHLIDPWWARPDFPYRQYGKVTQDAMDDIYKEVCNKFKDCHIHRMTSLEAVKMFPDNYFDWVYIDGDHDRAGEDIEAWLPKSKMVCGDDLDFPKVKEDLEKYNYEELPGNQWIIHESI